MTVGSKSEAVSTLNLKSMEAQVLVDKNRRNLLESKWKFLRFGSTL